MRERATALAVALGLVVAGVACSGGAEKNVVNQYFTALAANDTNTLTSFAAVAFDKEGRRLQDRVRGRRDPRAGSPCPTSWRTSRGSRRSWPRTRRTRGRGGTTSRSTRSSTRCESSRRRRRRSRANLQPIADKWDEFNEKDRQLKAAVARRQARGRVRAAERSAVGRTEGGPRLSHRRGRLEDRRPGADHRRTGAALRHGPAQVRARRGRQRRPHDVALGGPEPGPEVGHPRAPAVLRGRPTGLGGR